MERWLVQNKKQAEFFNKFVLDEAEAGRDRLYTLVRANRSTKQNNTLHLLFKRIAEALNEAGFEIEHPFNSEFSIPWTEVSVKTMLYQPIIRAMYDKESSSRLDTAQLSESMTTLVDAVSRNTGVFIPIPSEELLYGPS
jgi:hypothetical protein